MHWIRSSPQTYQRLNWGLLRDLDKIIFFVGMWQNDVLYNIFSCVTWGLEGLGFGNNCIDKVPLIGDYEIKQEWWKSVGNNKLEEPPVGS